MVPLTQQDLAELAGATRPTVNQSLKKLEAAGAVELYRGGVRIADAESCGEQPAPDPRRSAAPAPPVTSALCRVGDRRRAARLARS